MTIAMVRSRSHKPPGQRQLRVSEMLRKALAEVFLRTSIDDPDLAGMTLTVSEVGVSPDLRQATAFVMPLGGGSGARGAVAALERHKKFLRGELARRVSLKFMPSLTFKLDETFEEVERIDELLRSPKVSQDLEPGRN